MLGQLNKQNIIDFWSLTQANEAPENLINLYGLGNIYNYPSNPNQRVIFYKPKNAKVEYCYLYYKGQNVMKKKLSSFDFEQIKNLLTPDQTAAKQSKFDRVV